MIMFNSLIDGTDTISYRHKCVYESKDVPWHYVSRYRQGSCGVLYESRPPLFLFVSFRPFGLSIQNWWLPIKLENKMMKIHSILHLGSVAGPGRSRRSLHAGVIRRAAKLHQGEGKGRGYVYPRVSLVRLFHHFKFASF